MTVTGARPATTGTNGAITAADERPRVSDTARAFAQSQFPDAPVHRATLERAMTILEQTERGAGVARALEASQVRIEVGPIYGDMGGQYVPPFAGRNVFDSARRLLAGEPLPHVIRIAPSQADNPYVMAALLAHEGAHYELGTQPEKNLPIRIGAGLAGAAGMLLSLPTLGMMDMSGHFHAPGVGAIISMMQGSTLVSAMTQENHAYRVGDSVIGELGGRREGFVYDENGRERGFLDGGWRIASEYMKVTADTTTGTDTPKPTPVGMVVAPLVGLGLLWGLGKVATAVLHVPQRWAGYAVFGPGAVATALAGVRLVRSGTGLMLSRTTGYEHANIAARMEPAFGGEPIRSR